MSIISCLTTLHRYEEPGSTFSIKKPNSFQLTDLSLTGVGTDGRNKLPTIFYMWQ